MKSIELPCMADNAPCSECRTVLLKDMYLLELKIDSLKKLLRPDTDGVLGGHDRALFHLDDKGWHSMVLPGDKNYLKGHHINSDECQCREGDNHE
jgi:hypothetical protein